MFRDLELGQGRKAPRRPQAVVITQSHQAQFAAAELPAQVPLHTGQVQGLLEVCPSKPWTACRSYGVVRGNHTAALPFLPAEPPAAGDLISFLKALPDCRMRRGVRFPQWWMLLVAILAILSNRGFAGWHRAVCPTSL